MSSIWNHPYNHRSGKTRALVYYFHEAKRLVDLEYKANYLIKRCMEAERDLTKAEMEYDKKYFARQSGAYLGDYFKLAEKLHDEMYRVFGDKL